MLLMHLKRIKKANIMNRRTALKNLTLSLGYTVTAPTIFSILSSCNAEAETWTPLFLSPEEQHIVTHLVDIIIPKSDTPGALDVNIPQFIDLIFNEVESDENQSLFKTGSGVFSKAFTTQFNREAAEGKKEDFEKLLITYFNLSEEETELLFETQNTDAKAIPSETMDDYTLYKFLLAVRHYSILGYCTSEKIGKEVTAYDPVPGVYKGCIPVEEATQGKVWSL